MAHLSSPPGDHCLTGSLHEGDTRGKVETISEAPTYITSPHPGKGNGNILFYFPDIHGFYNNAFLLMDGFADAGYTVFGIDYFRNVLPTFALPLTNTHSDKPKDPIWKHRKDANDKTTDPGFDFGAWRDKHTTFAISTVPKWSKTIASSYGTETTKYACVGYCFGASFVLESLTSSSFISAGAFAHPGALTEEQFRNLAKPLLLSCAENDFAFPVEKRQEAEKLLKEGGQRYQIQLFQGVNHGFAVRCNLEVKYERFVKEQSYRGIVEWFGFWLGQ